MSSNRKSLDRTSPPRAITFKRALAAAAIFFVLAVALILSGQLDRFSPSGFIIPPMAIFVVALHLLLLLFALWIVLRFPRIKTQLFLVAGAIVLGLALAEIGVRYLHPAGAKEIYKFGYSPDYHHANLRNKELIFEPQAFGPSNLEKEGGLVHTNAAGMRSYYDREQFLKYPRRVLFLGDSFTFGLYVPQDKAFPQVLEQRWQEKLGQRGIAVLNAGVVSYSPFLQKLMFEKELAAWKPQIVVQVLDATDVADDIQYTEQVRQGPQGPYFPQKGFLKLLPSGDTWSDHCALCQRFYVPFSLLKAFIFHPVVMSTYVIGPSAIRIEVGGRQETNNFFIYRHPLETTLPYFEAMMKNIESVAGSVTRAGGRYLLVVPPRFQHWNVRECPNNWEADQYTLDDPYRNEMFRFFEERRGAVDFPILNLLPAFQATKEFPLVFEDDPHWNSAGHRFVAGEVEAELQRLGWLPEGADQGQR